MKRATIVFLVLAQGMVLRAQSLEKRATLKGLKTLSVRVSKLENDVERAGLSRDQIKTDVELRLRKAGLRVADSSLSYLYVNVGSLSHPPGTIFSINLGLNQPVTLVRDASITSRAETWRGNGGLGWAPDREFVSYARGALGDLIDAFINDYLAANQ